MTRTVRPPTWSSLRPLALLAAMVSLTACEAFNSLEDAAARGPKRWRVEVWSVPLPLARSPGVMTRAAEPPPAFDVGPDASEERAAAAPEARPGADASRAPPAGRAAKGQRVSAKQPVQRTAARPLSPPERAVITKPARKPAAPPARSRPASGVRADQKRT